MSNKKKFFVIFSSFVLLFFILLSSLFIELGLFFGISSKDIYSAFGIKEFSARADGYPLSIHFIDVGCGDSILIKCDNKTALIDTGSFSLKGKTSYYLEHCGVENLDLFIASHTDSDHIGDFSSVADKFHISEIWISDFCVPDISVQTDTELKFFDEITNKKISMISPDINKTYYLGDAELTVLSPSKKYDIQNDNSLVIKLVYGDISFLFTGDASKEAEETILKENFDLKSTVLKVSHHGSSSATTQEFLNAVSPKYAVISTGVENKYLPNREVIERIEGFGSEILRTDIDGTIIIASDGKLIEFFCENTEF